MSWRIIYTSVIARNEVTKQSPKKGESSRDCHTPLGRLAMTKLSQEVAITP